MMTQSELRRLKDYPLKEWMEAADGCDVCGGPYMVKVTWVDDSGDYGDVVIKANHKDNCPEGLEIGSYSPNMNDSCDRQDIAGWDYAEETVMVAGREWYPLKSRLNIAPCISCEALVVGVPLILFLEEGRKGELDFCFRCAGELGILSQLVRAPITESGLGASKEAEG